MLLNCFGIDKYDKLHGFVMYGHISHENDYTFQFLIVGSYDYAVMK